MEKLKNSNDVTKISDNKYKIKLSSEDVKSLVDTNDNVSSSELKGDIYVIAFVDADIVTKLEYDFSELLSGVDKFTMTIEFSDFNNAGDVEIPISVMN